MNAHLQVWLRYVGIPGLITAALFGLVATGLLATGTAAAFSIMSFVVGATLFLVVPASGSQEDVQFTADLARFLQRGRPWREYAVNGLLFSCAALSIFVTLGIVFVLLSQTITFFGQVSIGDVLFDTQWTPTIKDADGEYRYGIWPLLVGTLLTTFIAILVAVPFGLMAAIFLSEFASTRTRRFVKPVLEVLAGVPTVVYGYFALTAMTPILQAIFAPLGIEVASGNALSAGIVMGLMIIPTVASISEDAIYAVPMSLREGSYALGASKIKTIRHVVLPAAYSGIIASVILGISRAVGETMIVTIAAGAVPNMTPDPFGAVQTMTAYIVEVSLGDIEHGTTTYHTLYVVGFFLFITTLGLNLVAYAIRRRFMKGRM